jgi:hypothetical protein
MGGRKSGKLILDTGQFEAIKDEIIEAAREGIPALHGTPAPVLAIPKAPATPPPSDSSEALRSFCVGVYKTMQAECVTAGPISALAKEVREGQKAMNDAITQILAERDSQELARSKHLTWIVASFTIGGVLFNVLWRVLSAHGGG